jgi:RND family efflux transporter MFP subunit
MMEHTSNSTIDPSGATRSLRRAGIGFAIVAFVIVAWSLFSSRLQAQKLAAQTAARAVVTVATTRPQPAAAAAQLRLPGNVRATNDAPIHARTSGYLKRWLVDIGTRVKAGQLLAEIDAPELDQQLYGAEADVGTAEANARIAQTTAERWRGLLDTGSVSRQQVDEQASLADSRLAQLRAARANLQRLRELSAFKRIVAPFDGIVTERNTDIGDLITAGGSGAELFRVADTSRLLLYVRVPQAYATRMKPGLAAAVRFPDRPRDSYPARLDRTANALESGSRTLLVQLSVDNTANALLPGSYAEVAFDLPPEADVVALRLPANTLLSNGDGLQVATIQGGRVELKPVKLGRDFGSEIEVVDGLAAGDEVILSPPDSLTNDTAVRVVQPAPHS